MRRPLPGPMPWMNPSPLPRGEPGSPGVPPDLEAGCWPGEPHGRSMAPATGSPGSARSGTPSGAPESWAGSRRQLRGDHPLGMSFPQPTSANPIRHAPSAPPTPLPKTGKADEGTPAPRRGAGRVPISRSVRAAGCWPGGGRPEDLLRPTFARLSAGIPCGIPVCGTVFRRPPREAHPSGMDFTQPTAANGPAAPSLRLDSRPRAEWRMKGPLLPGEELDASRSPAPCEQRGAGLAAAGPKTCPAHTRQAFTRNPLWDSGVRRRLPASAQGSPSHRDGLRSADVRLHSVTEPPRSV